MMNRKTKIIVFTIFAIILICAGGFWLWNSNKNPVRGKASDYSITGSKVINNKAGLSCDVPSNWGVETINHAEGSVIIYSPGTEIQKDDIGAPVLPLEVGCLIEVATVYQYEKLEEIREDAGFYRAATGAVVNDFETTTLNGISALKHSFENEETGKANVFYVSKNHKTYSFAVYLPANEEEASQCLKDFGNFLETVSIK